MTTEELERFRSALMEERGRVVDAIDYLHEDDPSAPEDEAKESRMDDHLADTASITIDREVDYTLEENSGQMLAAIDRALARVEDGTYGRCLNCGKDIPVERLEALPYAELCIDCAKAA